MTQVSTVREKDGHKKNEKLSGASSNCSPLYAVELYTLPVLCVYGARTTSTVCTWVSAHEAAGKEVQFFATEKKNTAGAARRKEEQENSRAKDCGTTISHPQAEKCN